LTRPLVATLLALGLMAAAGAARANPRPLPFTYQTETLPAGAAEVEQFADYVPTRVQTGAGDLVYYGGLQFQTEIEYGITDKLELALYFTFVPEPGSERYRTLPLWPNGNGLKQRLRYRLADPEAWPIDVALYGEIAENEREIELEAKVILQRRFGRTRVITNLWAEREFYFDGLREWVLNPTLGATVEVTPKWHLGVEGWLRAEYPDGFTGPRPFNLGPHVYVGPTLLVNFGRIWWTTGAYLRATDWGRTAEAGDAFGKLWVRTIVGIGL
jgi:hypothetical protein